MSDVSKEFYTADEINKLTSPSYFEKANDGFKVRIVNDEIVTPDDNLDIDSMGLKLKQFNSSIENTFGDIVSNPDIIKKIGNSNNPAAEEAKLKNSIYLAKILNLPVRAVYNNYEQYSAKVIGGKSNDPLSDYQIIQRAKKVGELTVELNTLGWKWLNGQATEDDIKRIDEIIKTMPQDGVDFKRGLLVNMQRAFWQNWGIIRESIKAGINEGLVPGAAAGLGTVLLDTAFGGPAGLALSPATFLASITMGMGSASGRYIYKMEAGSEFIDLMQTKWVDDNGVEHDLPDWAKKVISHGVGGIVSALELSQVETLFTGTVVSKPLRAAAGKILKKIFKKATASKIFKATLVKGLKDYGKGLLAKNVSEAGLEVLQQIVSDTGVLIARIANEEKIDPSDAKELIKQYTGLAIDTFLVSTLLGAGPQALETTAGLTARNIEIKSRIDKMVKKELEGFDPQKETVSELVERIKSTEEWQELSRKAQEKTEEEVSNTAKAVADLQEAKEPLRTRPLAELREEDIKETIKKSWEDYKSEHNIAPEREAIEKKKFEAKKRKALQAVKPLSDELLQEEYRQYVEECNKLGVDPLSEAEYRDMRGENISDIKIYSMDSRQKHLAIFGDVIEGLKKQVEQLDDVPDVVNKMIVDLENKVLEASNNIDSGYTVNDIILQTRDEIRILDERIDKLQSKLSANIASNYKTEIYKELGRLRSERFDKQVMLDSYESLLNKAFKNYYRYDSFVSTIKDRIQRLQKYIAEQQAEDFVKNADQLVIDLMTDPNFRRAIGLEPEVGKTENINIDESTFDKYMHLAIKAGYFAGGEAKKQEILKEWIVKRNRTSYEKLLKDTIKDTVDQILKTETKNISARRVEQIEAIKKLVSEFTPDKTAFEKLYNLIEQATKNDNEKTDIDEIVKAMAELNIDSSDHALTVEKLLKIRDYVDFLRFIGKKELEELKKPQLMLEGKLKDAVIEKLGKYKANAPKGSELERSGLKGFKKLANGVKVFAMMPKEWAERIGGDTWVDVFVKEKLMTKREELINEERRANLLRTFIEDLGEKPETFFDTVIIDGKEYQKQDLMFYYLGRENEMTRDALVNQNGIPETLLNNVEQYLTENEKLIAQEIADDFQEVYPRLSQAYETLTGRRLGFQKNWVPQIRELDVTNADIDKDTANIMLLGMDVEQVGVYKRFTYERIGGNTPIRTDLYGLWRDTVPKQEHYISSAKLVATMKRVIGDNDVKKAIASRFGQSWVHEVEKYIDAYASPQSLHATDFLSRMLRWIKNGTATSALVLNGPVVARMPVSIVFYLMKSGFNNLLSASWQFVKNPIEVYNFVKERDPATIRSGTEYEFMNIKSKNDLLKLKDKIINGAFKPIELADRITKVIGWKAVYDSVVDEIGEYNAIKEARFWTDLTQPSGDKTTLPSMYRSHELLSLINLFTQQPNKIFNLLYYDITGLVKGGDYGTAFLGLFSIATSMTAMWMITNRRLPKDENDAMEIFLAGNLSIMPIVGKALYGITQSQYPSHPSYVDIAKPYVEALMKKSYRDPKARERLALDFLKSFAIAGKIPYVGPYRIIKSIENSDPSYFFFGGPIGINK